MNKIIGTLYGISIGPGDPELITLKGKRLLKEASTELLQKGKKKVNQMKHKL